MKVLHGHASKDPNFLASFRAEVRAAAALDHPGIALVLDHGEVSASVNTPDLMPGCPWFAMELASGGTLSQATGRLPWTVLRSVLLAILDALAHAHSRGVIHRDLKPSNILIATESDSRPGLKLTDLGIAHALDTENTGPQEAMIMGTPMYMAPEQVRGAWRDHGPWTDLYALGCVATLLATGRAPFDPQRPGHAIMVDQLRTEPRAFHPTHAVPSGFKEWLQLLLAKNRFHRFQTAPDAAAALMNLGEVPPSPSNSDLELYVRATAAVPRPPRQSQPIRLDPMAKAPRAPFPQDWRDSRVAPPSLHLSDAGLSLYGLRTISMVGREQERDRLWGALEAVHSSGQARMVIIRGAAGSGKTRLARWLCERASETGAATITQTQFSPELSPGAGIRGLGNRYLRTHDLPREGVASRATEWMRAQGGSLDEAKVLTELLSPASTGTANAVRLTRPREYHAGVTRVFQRMAAVRPLIVWLDDVHWGFHGLGLARYILDAQVLHPSPILVVATVRDDALVDRPDETRRLETLAVHPRTETVSLAALPRRQHQAFIEELLKLDTTVAQQVAERTAGNPLFAVQLVGDWIQQGLLEPGPDGFVLRPGEAAPLPESLHAVWSSRLDRVLEEFDEEACDALELAAVLGPEVRSAEWHQAVDDPEGYFGDRFPGGRSLRTRLVERLLEERLATGTPERWAFVHGMLKETLELRSRSHKRWKKHNIAAATMLMARHPDPMTLPAERLGFHLLAAGRTDAAILPLLGGIEQRLVASGTGPALSLLDVTSRSMLDMSLPESDKRWGRIWTVTARIHLERGDVPLAKKFNRQALVQSRQHGWTGVELYALHGEAMRHLHTGDLARTERSLQDLLTAATEADSALHIGRAHLGNGRLALRRDRRQDAIEHLEHATVALATHPLGLAEARLELARAHGAPEPYEKAIQALREVGSGRLVAEAQRELGVLLEPTQTERAQTLFSAAAERFDNLGSAVAAAECRLRLCGITDLPPFEALRGDLRQLIGPARAHTTAALSLLEHAVAREWRAMEQLLEEGPTEWNHPWAQSLLRSAADHCRDDQPALSATLTERASS